MWTLAVGSLMALASATLFVVIGVVIARRSIPKDPGRARAAFATFWFAAAATSLVIGVRGALVVAGVRDVPLLLALGEFETPGYLTASGCLLYYIVYLLTGRTTAAVPIALFQLAMFVALRRDAILSQPVGYEVLTWSVDTVFAASRGPEHVILVALAATPVLLAVSAFVGLLFHVRDPASRDRIAKVAGALVVWVGAEALALTGSFLADDTGDLVRHVVALVASGLVLRVLFTPVRAKGPQAVLV